MNFRLIFSLLFSLSLVGFSFGQQTFTNLEDAAEVAQKENKEILMVFSGSDWCKPCILLKREIMDTPTFKAYAEQSLVLVKLDFPFRKQNQLSKEQQAYNGKLADKYNPAGAFPGVILLDKDMQTIQSIGYKSGMGANVFIDQIKKRPKS